MINIYELPPSPSGELDYNARRKTMCKRASELTDQRLLTVSRKGVDFICFIKYNDI
jgi:hypothetical protein